MSLKVLVAKTVATSLLPGPATVMPVMLPEAELGFGLTLYLNLGF